MKNQFKICSSQQEFKHASFIQQHLNTLFELYLALAGTVDNVDYQVFDFLNVSEIFHKKIFSLLKHSGVNNPSATDIAIVYDLFINHIQQNHLYNAIEQNKEVMLYQVYLQFEKAQELAITESLSDILEKNIDHGKDKLNTLRSEMIEQKIISPHVTQSTWLTQICANLQSILLETIPLVTGDINKEKFNKYVNKHTESAKQIDFVIQFFNEKMFLLSLDKNTLSKNAGQKSYSLFNASKQWTWNESVVLGLVEQYNKVILAAQENQSDKLNLLKDAKMVLNQMKFYLKDVKKNPNAHKDKWLEKLNSYEKRIDSKIFELYELQKYSNVLLSPRRRGSIKPSCQ